MFKNWKTSFFGFGVILSGVAMIIVNEYLIGATAILSGSGLIVAKDGDINLNNRK
jgi:hypothetical protein